MKIRIKGNSLRYRLTRPEVAKLGTDAYLEDTTAFTGGTFIYAIEATQNDKLLAEFINNKITLKMPQRMIDELVNTDTVGFDDHSGTVSLLVEKDFVCIDNTTEDQRDNYPNPSLTCQ
ncbi:MAG: hypothetical protein QM768_20385 [Agriterribacter sp.]